MTLEQLKQEVERRYGFEISGQTRSEMLFMLERYSVNLVGL